MRVVHSRTAGGALAVAAVLTAAWAFTAAGQPQPAMPKEDQLKPKWEVGDWWVVKTATLPPGVRAGGKGDDGKEAPKPEPIVAEWKFTVGAKEKLGTHECFRVDVTVEPAAKGQPVTKLWYDVASLTLRQLETQLPVDGGYVTVTESYQTAANAPPPPVVGPLTALPVELPMFVGGRPGEQSFSYESVSGKAGAKRDPADVAFAVDVKQTLTPTTPDKARGLLPKEFTRDLKTKQLVEVKLITAEREVVQLWEAGAPWPVFTTSGPTTATLIKTSKK